MIGPVVAPVGTEVAIDVAETTTKGAAMPLNFTLVAPVKLVPVMVTPVPTPPVVGVKLVMVGAGTTKLVELVPVPSAVVTVRGPVVAPAGTLAVILVAVLVLTTAGTPLNFTDVAPARLVPVMVTMVPTSPEAGVKPVWFRLPTGLVRAWQVEVALQRLGGETLTYGSVIAAADGALLFRKDHREADAFGYRVWASDPVSRLPDDGPQGLAGTPHPTGTPSGYQAPFAPRTLVTLQSLPFSRNDPWLPAGATTTSGNNVVAYADLSAPDHFSSATGSLDVRGTVSAPGVFDWAYDLTKAPAATPAQVQASIVQLFYANNAFHDWYYDAGFDEAAGNAQASNLGRGGAEGDPLLAEAQDYSGTDNANMTTPPDGFSPWMQMFVWSNSDLLQALVTAPAGLAGPKEAQAAQFGPQLFETAGDLAAASPATACTTPAGVSGKIALVDRGTCTFAVKVKNAQLGGATGVLIRNVLATSTLNGMAGTDATIDIPSLLIGRSDGAALGAALASGTTSVTLRRVPGLMRDGSIDDLVVAHEWGHFISNRLVQDAAGLDTIQARAMGEGFGDFHALLLAVRAEDAAVAANAGWAGVYATANFVTSGTDWLGAPNEGYYYGTRRTPYSTDMTKAPLTFRHVMDGAALPSVTPPLLANGSANSEVHNAGEVWATALWECYAALLRATQGASPRLTFDEAQLRMRHYLVAAYKLMPASPTFLEGRDALLAAAAAGDRADLDAFWAAFAKRGFGVGAVAPPRHDATNAGVVESFTLGGDLALVSASFGQVTSSCDDADGRLDGGETGTLTLTLRNTGASALAAGSGTMSSSNASLAFPDGPRTVVAASQPGGTTTATVRVAFPTSPVTRQLVPLRFTPADGYLAAPTVVTLDLLVNYDVTPAASATDDLEGDTFLWSPGRDAGLWHAAGWTRGIGLSGGAADHALHGPDPDGPADLWIASPPVRVGTGAFSIEWNHAYDFEADTTANYDGGVVELSADGGTTWVDVGAPLYTGQIAAYTDNRNPLQDGATGRRAFVGASPSYAAGGLTHAALSLGTAWAGRTVQVRFRVGADNGTGGGGWYVDDVAFHGILDTPFDLVVADVRRCVNRAPVASAGPDASAASGALVQLAGSGQDPDGQPVSFAWSQVSGPTVTLASATVAAPTFTAPSVTTATPVVLRLTVSDGTLSASDDVTLTITPPNRPPVASAGAAQVVDSGAQVTLDASGSTDPDPGTTLGYAWVQSAGTAVTLTGAATARPTFTAPTGPAVLTLQVTVTDGTASASATTTVEVRAPASGGGGGGCSAGGASASAGALLPLLALLGPRRRRTGTP